MNILITICARGGSKGIPGKNIKAIGGQPLIAYTIKIAQAFSALHNASIVLSTDDADIKKTAANAGLKTQYERPAELASDSAGKIDTIKDVLFYKEKETGTIFDIILDLDVTSPLRTIADLEAAYDKLLGTPEALTIFSVNPAQRNPYFNMVEEAADGYCRLVKKPETGVMTRQSAPKVYDLNASFYFYRRDFFNTGIKTPITDRSLIYTMPHICFDLDHPIDFEFLSYLLEHKKLEIAI